jgi:hypothetical protein
MIPVVLAWVLFRSADIDTAGRIYLALIDTSSLPGSFGIAEARQFAYDIEQQLTGLGSGSGLNLAAAAIWLPVAAAIAFLGPNTQWIMERVSAGLQTPGYPSPLDGGTVRLFRRLHWRPNLPWGIVLGVIAAISLLKLNDVSEFIYFQF